MNLLLTSCGLETKAIENQFVKMLDKPPAEIRAMFIPTAAIFPDAVEVLPKCLNDLLECGIKRENIFVYDLHDPIKEGLSDICDVVYICGGSPEYLLRRINEQGFNNQLQDFINQNGIVVGVSAGSIIFAKNLPGNLDLLPCTLDVHCSDDTCNKAGCYNCGEKEHIRLGNNQAIRFENSNIIIFD